MRNYRPVRVERETDEQWRARAIDAYNHRNDPPPPRDPSWPDFSALYAMNFDVLDDDETKAWNAWFSARDDRLLWRTSYTINPGTEPNGPYIAERAIPIKGTGKFVASSWTDLRQLIERAEQS
jgi:hypothetical protein